LDRDCGDLNQFFARLFWCPFGEDLTELFIEKVEPSNISPFRAISQLLFASLASAESSNDRYGIDLVILLSPL
jgi:hypothetical protein